MAKKLSGSGTVASAGAISRKVVGMALDDAISGQGVDVCRDAGAVQHRGRRVAACDELVTAASGQLQALVAASGPPRWTSTMRAA